MVKGHVILGSAVLAGLGYASIYFGGPPLSWIGEYLIQYPFEYVTDTLGITEHFRNLGDLLGGEPHKIGGAACAATGLAGILYGLVKKDSE